MCDGCRRHGARSPVRGSIGGDALTAAWSTSPAYFPTGPTVVGQAEALVELAASNGWTQIALMYCAPGAALCQDAADAVKAAAGRHGVTVVSESQHPTTRPPTGCPSNVDATIVVFEGRAVSKMNCAGPLLTTALAMDQNASFDGTWSVLPTAPWNSPAAAGYHQRTDSIEGIEHGFSSSAMYAATEALTRSATKGTWGATVTSAQIRAGLAALEGDTLGGFVPPLDFGAEARCAYPVRWGSGDWQPFGSGGRCW